MNEFIYSNPNSLSSEVCSEIIKLFEDDTTGKGKYDGVVAGGMLKHIKDTTDLIIPKDDKNWYKIHKLLEKELAINIKKYKSKLQNDNYNFSRDDENEYNIFESTALSTDNFMIQRYLKEKGRYIYHHDFSAEWNKNRYRIITFLWYLNTVEEGGETEFWGEHKVKPEAGKLILFPASWTFPHCGKMPISSNKYIITGWLYVFNK